MTDIKDRLRRVAGIIGGEAQVGTIGVDACLGALERIEELEGEVKDHADLIEKVEALITIVERVGCVRWQSPEGFRLKDTDDWVNLYNAAAAIRGEKADD